MCVCDLLHLPDQPTPPRPWAKHPSFLFRKPIFQSFLSRHHVYCVCPCRLLVSSEGRDLFRFDYTSRTLLEGTPALAGKAEELRPFILSVLVAAVSIVSPPIVALAQARPDVPVLVLRSLRGRMKTADRPQPAYTSAIPNQPLIWSHALSRSILPLVVATPESQQESLAVSESRLC